VRKQLRKQKVLVKLKMFGELLLEVIQEEITLNLINIPIQHLKIAKVLIKQH
jgi:hypothetical protein